MKHDLSGTVRANGVVLFSSGAMLAASGEEQWTPRLERSQLSTELVDNGPQTNGEASQACGAWAALLARKQPLRRQLVYKREEIRLQGLARGVKFTLHRFPHLAQRTMLLAQLPDSHAHRVETEVRALV